MCVHNIDLKYLLESCIYWKTAFLLSIIYIYQGLHKFVLGNQSALVAVAGLGCGIVDAFKT